MFPENDEVWELWQAVATQWRTGGMGGLIGLDYQAVDKIAGWLGIEICGWTFDRLSAIERHVLRGQNKSEDKIDISEYCKSCAISGKNIDCYQCVLNFTRGKDAEQS